MRSLVKLEFSLLGYLLLKKTFPLCIVLITLIKYTGFFNTLSYVPLFCLFNSSQGHSLNSANSKQSHSEVMKAKCVCLLILYLYFKFYILHNVAINFRTSLSHLPHKAPNSIMENC